MAKNLYGADPVEAAVYDAAHGYRDPVTGKKGVAPLAERMNVNAAVLQNKVNPTYPTHITTLRDFRQILLHTGNLEPLYILNEEFNHVAVAVDVPEDVSDMALIEHLAQIDIEKGEFMAELKKALEDGQVSDWEYEAMYREGMDIVRAIMKTLKRLEGLRVRRRAMHLVEDDKGRSS